MATGYRIGHLEIHLAAHRLTRDGCEIDVERKVFDVLAYLCQRPDTAVTRQELLEAVWGRSIASDAVVAQVISKLRGLLSEHAGLPEAVKTVRGVGYRLDARVEPLAETVAIPEDRRFSRPVGWAVVGLLLVAVTLLSLLLQRPGPPSTPMRIALLDMENRTGDSGLEWAAVGATALMSQGLRQRGLEVISGRQLAALLQESEGDEDPGELIPRLTGVEIVLAPRLMPADQGFRLELVALGGRVPSTRVLLGSDPASLSLAMADLLADEVRAPLPSPGGAGLLDNAFLNEAYARAFHHQQRGELRPARELLEYILDHEHGFHWAQYQLAIVHQQEGQFDQARELLQPLLSQVVDDAWLAAAIRSTLGNLDWYAGDYESAHGAYRDAYARFEAAGLDGGMAATLGNLGMVANTLGDFQTGRDLANQALAIYRRQNNRIHEARQLHNLGFSYKESGDFEIALGYLRQAYAMRTELGLQWQAANSLAAIGETLVQVGQLDEGVRLLEQALEVFRRADNSRGEGIVLADLATAHKHAGRFDQARQFALDSLALARARGEPAGIASLALLLGQIEVELGAEPVAVQYFREALALYTDLGLDRGRAAALMELARQSARQGDRAAAEVWLSEFDAIDPMSVDPRSSRAASLVRFRMAGLDQADTLAPDQLLAWLLDDFDQNSMEVAELAAELAKMLADHFPEHPRMEELRALIAPWRATFFPAARAGYLLAREPQQCSEAITALRELRGEAWSAGLAEHRFCG